MSLKIDSNIPGIPFDLEPVLPPPIYPPYWSPDSYWYQKIPEDAPLHADSTKKIAYLMSIPEQYELAWRLNIYTYSYPVYHADETTPRFTVYQSDGVTPWSKGIDVPIPTYAEVAPGTDQSLKIVDWVKGMVYDGWKVSFSGGKWKAGAWWGWAIDGSGIGENFKWVMGGSSTPAVATLITPEEIEAGYIGHPLACGLKTQMRKYWVYPPACNPNSTTAPASAYEILSGERIQLDPSFDIGTLGLNKAGETIYRAMQEFGVMAKEGAGRSVIYAECPYRFTLQGKPDPWKALGVTETMFNATKFKSLPWQVPDPSWYGGKVYSY